MISGSAHRGEYRQAPQAIAEALTVLRSDWPFVPVLANVLRPRISVLRPVDKPVDKLIRQFDRVANGVELTIQFVVHIYGHNQNGDQEPCNRVQEKIVPKSFRQFRN
jgi:hypothetical protein